jgi:hypothetical protein
VSVEIYLFIYYIHHTIHALSPKGQNISDIPPRYPHFTKITSYEKYCRRYRW